MGVYLILPTLVVILVSFLIVRAAAIALMMTGMDEKKARFQALSAFTGTGFTTKEAELVVNNPRRRQIMTWLMILGNAGIVTVIVTATSSFATSRGYQLPISIGAVIIGAYLIYLLTRRTGFARGWERFVKKRFTKWRVFEEGTTEDLLHLVEGYGLVRVIVTPDSPLAGNPVSAVGLKDKELLIVGIERGRDWIPLPKSSEIVAEGDNLVVYGQLKTMRDMFNSEQD